MSSEDNIIKGFPTLPVTDIMGTIQLVIRVKGRLAHTCTFSNKIPPSIPKFTRYKFGSKSYYVESVQYQIGRNLKGGTGVCNLKITIHAI